MTGQWYYTHKGKQSGPVSFEDLQTLAASGDLASTDEVWRQGSVDWVPATAVPGLVSQPSLTAASAASPVAAPALPELPVPAPFAPPPPPPTPPAPPRPRHHDPVTGAARRGAATEAPVQGIAATAARYGITAPLYRGTDQEPVPLPRPLGDPLRGFRRFLSWLLALPLLAALACAILWIAFAVAIPDSLQWALMVAVLPLPVTAFFWRILPNRVTNAIYLRSFRNDRDTWPIRKALQAALGRRFRLSGIRDPHRRWPVLLRFLGFTIFLFRYCTPKFMNLEAGTDWKARLWRSLGDTRCAFIDVTDLTPFVKEEIELACTCLGLSRVLFLGNATRSVEDWRRRIAAALPLGTPLEAIHVAVWQGATRERRKAFAEEVRTFAAALPAGTAGLRCEAFPLVYDTVLSGEARRAEDAAFWLSAVLGIVLVLAARELYWAFAPIGRVTDPRLFPLLALNAYIGILVVNYLVDCGSIRERVVTSVCLALVLLWLGGILRAAGKVRDAADRAISGNNLKQIALAFHNYRYVFKRFPTAAIYSQEGKPLLSWRVAILPYIEQKTLYQRFNLNEPWDSPHNKALLDDMPEEFAPPGADKGKGHLTHYRVFTGPGTLFADRWPARLTNIRDGPSNTLLVIEAREPVPWTKPDDLPYKENGLPALGMPGREWICAAFCDGAVRVFRPDPDEKTLRAAITPVGGEEVDWGRLE